MLRVEKWVSEEVRESEMRTRGILQRKGSYLPGVEGRINKKNFQVWTKNNMQRTALRP